MLIPSFWFIPLPLPLGNKSVFYVSESVSFVSYFRFHIEVISNDICLPLSNLLSMVISRYTCVLIFHLLCLRSPDKLWASSHQGCSSFWACPMWNLTFTGCSCTCFLRGSCTQASDPLVRGLVLWARFLDERMEVRQFNSMGSEVWCMDGELDSHIGFQTLWPSLSGWP